MAAEITCVLECRWVAPVRPTGVLLEHHAIAIAGDRIAAVAPTDALRRAHPDAARVPLPRHLVTPGLVNLHTHAAMALLRGVGDDLPLERWLHERIWPLEAALVSDAFVHDGTLLAGAEMLRAGVTCFSDMYFHPDAAVRAARALGLRIVAGAIAIEFPTRYASDADDYLRKGLAARDAWRDDPCVSFALAPHAPYTVADATLRRIAMLAEELDLPIHMHVHETASEVSDAMARDGCRPLERLERLGLVNERLIAVHAVHLTDAEIALLASRGASVAHCPASNLKLASGMARLAALLGAGVNVGIGTDGAASNDRLDVLAETRLAALLAKGVAGDAAAVGAVRALEAATFGGARALGLDARIGSIETGKQADLTAFDLSALETRPTFDPVGALIYAAGREQVTDVWVAGASVVQKRQLVPRDETATEPEISRLAATWQNSILQALNKAA